MSNDAKLRSKLAISRRSDSLHGLRQLEDLVFRISSAPIDAAVLAGLRIQLRREDLVAHDDATQLERLVDIRLEHRGGERHGLERVSRGQCRRQRQAVAVLIGHADGQQRLDRALRIPQRVDERRRPCGVIGDQRVRDRQPGPARLGELAGLDFPAPEGERMADPQRLQAGADGYDGCRGLGLDIVVELLRGPTDGPLIEVSRPAVPSGADVVEGHSMIGIAELASNAPVFDLDRDAARMREVLRVEAEDGYVSLVQFADDGIGVLIVVVGDDQDCGRHGSHLSDFVHEMGAGTAVPAPIGWPLTWRRGSALLGDDVVDHDVGVHVDLNGAESVERLASLARARERAHLGADLGVEVVQQLDWLGELERQRKAHCSSLFEGF